VEYLVFASLFQHSVCLTTGCSAIIVFALSQYHPHQVHQNEHVISIKGTLQRSA